MERFYVLIVFLLDKVDLLWANISTINRIRPVMLKTIAKSPLRNPQFPKRETNFLLDPVHSLRWNDGAGFCFLRKTHFRDLYMQRAGKNEKIDHFQNW